MSIVPKTSKDLLHIFNFGYGNSFSITVKIAPQMKSYIDVSVSTLSFDADKSILPAAGGCRGPGRHNYYSKLSSR